MSKYKVPSVLKADILYREIEAENLQDLRHKLKKVVGSNETVINAWIVNETAKERSKYEKVIKL